MIKLALKFEVVTFNGATISNVNGQDVYNVDSKLLVEGIGAKVKLYCPFSSYIYVSTEPIDSQLTGFGSMVRLNEMPDELYLAPGEKIYAVNADYSFNSVKIIHYLDQAPADQSEPLYLSGSINLSQI